MGGKPSRGTSKDMRLAANKPKSSTASSKTGKQSKPNQAAGGMKKISTD